LSALRLVGFFFVHRIQKAQPPATTIRAFLPAALTIVAAYPAGQTLVTDYAPPDTGTSG
jgi:hypothetical protein